MKGKVFSAMAKSQLKVGGKTAMIYFSKEIGGEGFVVRLRSV